MSNLMRLGLYNAEPAASQDLRARIEELNFVRLVSEVATPDALAATLRDDDVNLLFFHLDPDPAAVVDVIEQVAARFPDLAMIAAGHETGPSAILAPMRAGCDQFVCEPIDPVDLAAAVARVASKRAIGQTKSRCMCVTGASGGVGATLIASNLALEIGALTERECVLVDMDFQFGNQAVNFDCAPQFTFYDLATSGAELDRSILVKSLTELPCKVALLARPEQMQQHEAITAGIVHRALEVLSTIYENVVIDLPRNIDQRNLAALTQADLVLVVCQLLVPNIRNTRRYLDALVSSGIPEDRIEIVVNRGEGSGGRVSVKDLEETIKKPIFASVPNDYQYVAQSIDFGQPISAVDRKNPVRSAIFEMAKKIVSGRADEKSPPKKQARRGLFGRLLSK